MDRPDERVSVLRNGLTVILKAHRTAPVVSVRMYCRTGSIYEQEYLGSGMSHLFEHLLHGGATTTRSTEDSRRMLDQIGGNTNAYTSYDVTCYFIDTAREHAAQAVDLLGDWITHPTFPQEDFDREWGVVQRELERDVDDPAHQLFQLTMETMYPRHPACFPVIGWQPIVQALTKADIVGYYRRMYVPDNIVVVIVGDIELDAALADVQRSFTSFERQKPPTIVLPDEPPMVTPRQATKRMKVQAALLQLAWPSIPLTHPDLYALDLLSYLLAQGDSARLARQVRDRGLVFSIDSSSWTPDWARGIFTVGARLAPDRLAAATAAILEQVRAVQEQLVPAEELAKAKQQKAAEHVFATQTAASIAEMIAGDFRSTGDIHFSQAYVDQIQQVTPEQVREAARQYLQPNRLATITILPEDYQPATRPLAKGGAPEPVKRITLENGLRCLIRRDPTTPLVAIQSFSLGGVLLEDESTNGLSRLAAVLAPRGTETRSADDIAGFFDARGASFDGTSANNTIYFQAQVLSKDFAEAMDVFADVVCHPAFPDKELETFRPRLLDQIARVDETWRSELLAFLQGRFFRGSPYRFQAVGSKEVVARATRQQVADFYRRCVTGPNTVVAVFGDVDEAKAEVLLRKLFVGLPNAKPALPAPPPEQRDAPVVYIKPKPPTRDVAGVALAFPGMTVGGPDFVPMTVLDTIISGYRYPSGWLHEALRGGTRGLVYEVHAQNIAGPIPGDFVIYAACQPEQVKAVYGIIGEQLAKARAHRFTEGELAEAKTIITTTDLMEQQTNSERAMQSALDELYGLGYDYRERQFARQIQAVTLDDVKWVADKYLTVPTVAVVTPEPQQVDLGIEDVHVERSEPQSKPRP